MSTAPKGRFVWYDLMTTDPEAAQAFYSKLLDWDMQPIEGGDMPYTVINNRGVSQGGISTIPPQALEKGAPPYWMAYISTPDLDETVVAGVGAGARVLVPPTDVPEMGAFSVIQDPQGAVVALYREDVAPDKREDELKPGQVSWHELATTDWEAADRFYTEVFGWEDAGTEDLGPMGTYKMFLGGNFSRGGMFTKPAEMEGPAVWWIYFLVDDVHAAVEQVKTLGGQVVNGPMEVPGGDTVASFLDPQGATFAVHQR